MSTLTSPRHFKKMNYSSQIRLVCLLKIHNGHITSRLDIINFLWLCVAEVNPHAKRFWWRGYLFPLKALNLNKINVRTRNWGPTLVAKDMFRTMSHSWIDFTDTEYLKEEVGDAIMQCMPGWEGLSARWNYSNVRFMLISPVSLDLRCQGLISTSSEFSFAQQFWQSTIFHPFRRIVETNSACVSCQR